MASAHGFALGPFLFRADHLIFRGPRLWGLFIKPFSAASWFAPDPALCGARLRLAKDLACDVGQATRWLMKVCFAGARTCCTGSLRNSTGLNFDSSVKKRTDAGVYPDL